MKVKYIFFDFDGVLAESVDIKTEAFRKMYLQHGKDFSQKVVDHHLRNGGISRYEKFKIYNGEWLKEDISPKRIKLLANLFSELVVDGVIKAPEVEGTLQFLNSSKAYKKYIITGTPTVEIKPILKRRGIDHFFVESFGSPETKDKWVKHIMKNEGISCEECVFIGDALADYNAAKSNNIPFILRETKIGENLFKEYSGHRIKNLTNLHKVLDKIGEMEEIT